MEEENEKQYAQWNIKFHGLHLLLEHTELHKQRHKNLKFPGLLPRMILTRHFAIPS